MSLIDCAKKELQEEAGLTEEMASNIKPVDAISYAYEDQDEGICIEADFVFDIKLPNDFVPQNTDGEVECFYLMSVKQVCYLI